MSQIAIWEASAVSHNPQRDSDFLRMDLLSFGFLSCVTLSWLAQARLSHLFGFVGRQALGQGIQQFMTLDTQVNRFPRHPLQQFLCDCIMLQIIWIRYCWSPIWMNSQAWLTGLSHHHTKYEKQANTLLDSILFTKNSYYMYCGFGDCRLWFRVKWQWIPYIGKGRILENRLWCIASLNAHLAKFESLAFSIFVWIHSTVLQVIKLMLSALKGCHLDNSWSGIHRADVRP